MSEVDAEVLIKLVQAKPVLWDKTSEAYKDRCGTRDAWREICEELKSDFNEVEDDEKNLFGKDVIRRWTNIRDCFARYLKQLKENKKTGTKGKKQRKYIFYDQLQFLNKIYEGQDREDGVKLGSEAGEDDTELQPSTEDGEDLYKKNANRKRIAQDKKHRKLDEVELRILEALETEKPDSRMSFLHSLMPHLNKFNEQDFLQFQMEVLKLIENMHERKKRKVAHKPPVFNCSTPIPSYQIFPTFHSSFAQKPTPSPSHAQEFSNQMSCFIPQLVNFLSQNPSLLSQMTTCNQPPSFFSHEPIVTVQQQNSTPSPKRARTNEKNSHPHQQSTSQNFQQFGQCTSPESDLDSPSLPSPGSSIPDNVDFGAGD